MDYVCKIRLPLMFLSDINDILVSLLAMSRGNFDSSKHIISGVSRTSQVCPQCNNFTFKQDVIKFHVCYSIYWFKLWSGFDFLLPRFEVDSHKKWSCILVTHSCWLLDTMFDHLLWSTISIFCQSCQSTPRIINLFLNNRITSENVNVSICSCLLSQQFTHHYPTISG